MVGMTSERIISASRDIDADAAVIFELIADPAQQPSWDGNGNLAEAAAGQRVHAVGDAFLMTNTTGRVRENRIVEFTEARRIAWLPSEVGGDSPGHLWRWELEPLEGGGTRVTHTYDWTNLDPTDTMRVQRATSTTSDNLAASIDRLAAAAESN